MLVGRWDQVKSTGRAGGKDVGREESRRSERTRLPLQQMLSLVRGDVRDGCEDVGSMSR